MNNCAFGPGSRDFLAAVPQNAPRWTPEKYKTPSCLHRASIVSKHFLSFQLMHTIIKL